jgi:hypothetical protein
MQEMVLGYVLRAGKNCDRRRSRPRSCEDPPIDLERLTIAELLSLSRRSLQELRRRGVVRTGNAPIGDYAELLVMRATGADGLEEPSNPSWDVTTPTGEKLQVKARIVLDPKNAGQRQLSPFRSFTFDAAVVVLFDDACTVWKAMYVPREVVEENARYSEHVRGHILYARDDLLDDLRVEDWAVDLRAVEG